MKKIDQAVSVIRQGGVIAYPTEYCFGLGCDPTDEIAVNRILDIKRRSVEQGVILIAADVSQVNEYANVELSPIKEQLLASWPGPVTWTLPVRPQVPDWIKGKHETIAMRITAHVMSASICKQFGHAIVSTSANRHTEGALLSATEVETEMASEVDFIVTDSVGGAMQASQIRDGLTGEILR